METVKIPSIEALVMGTLIINNLTTPCTQCTVKCGVIRGENLNTENLFDAAVDTSAK